MMSGKPVAIVTGASRGAGCGIAVRVDHADDAQLKALMAAAPE